MVVPRVPAVFLATMAFAGPAPGADGQGQGELVLVPMDHQRMDPVEPPRPRADDEPAGVEEILERRRKHRISPIHQHYPRVPGCEPVPGPKRKLPLADRSHYYTSRGLCLPAQWVDSFFSREGADFHDARTLVRVIGSSRWQDHQDRSDEVRVNARVSLPHTSDRLTLVFRSDDQNDDRLAEREVIEEGEPVEDGVFRAGLRWAAYQTRRVTAQLETGARGTAPFVRTRYRYRQRLPLSLGMRFNQEFYWRGNEDRRGSATELQFERALTPKTSLRLTSSAESNTRLRASGVGWRWSQGLAHFQRISKRSALQAGLRASGISEPAVRTETWLASVRYRRSFWRPWLYFEIEPYRIWQRVDDFEGANGVTARLEVQFGDYP